LKIAAKRPGVPGLAASALRRPVDSVLKLQRYFMWEYEDYKVGRE
jgi:hypothetical protein